MCLFTEAEDVEGEKGTRLSRIMLGAGPADCWMTGLQGSSHCCHQHQILLWDLFPETLSFRTTKSFQYFQIIRSVTVSVSRPTMSQSLEHGAWRAPCLPSFGCKYFSGLLPSQNHEASQRSELSSVNCQPGSSQGT